MVHKEQHPTIALFTMGTFSHTNAEVERILTRAFPACRVKRVDLRKMLTVWDRLRNAVVALAEYGEDILMRRRSLKECMEHTSYFLKRTNAIARRVFRTDELKFTFQTQSLFDASREGVPHFLYTDHTHLANLGYPSFDPKSLWPAWWRDHERQIYANAACTFTMSERIARSVCEEYGRPESNVQSVYAGTRYLPSTTKNTVHVPASQNILFVGLDWNRKGGPELLQAFEELKETHPQATLTIVGSRPDCSVPGCIVVGAVSPELMQRYYLTSAVFCMPSKVEPFGLVFLEAMAYGLPVVGTQIGAIPEIIQHGVNGLLVAPANPADLAAALRQIFDNPDEAKAMGEQGRRMVLERFTWDAVGARMTETINAVLEEQSSTA